MVRTPLRYSARFSLFWYTPAMIILGLGNPGTKYTHTRHNVGAFFISQWLEQSGGNRIKDLPTVALFRMRVADAVAVGGVPKVFMNQSGEAARDALASLSEPPESLVVLHDDLDIPFGDIRLSRGRGDAGQRGVRSIIETLHTKDFYRLRIGIGRPPMTIPAESFVLQEFTAEEKLRLPEIATQLEAELALLLHQLSFST